MGFFGGGKGGNESGGKVNGSHRGKPAKGKGGVNKPLKGTRHKGSYKLPPGKAGRPDPYVDDDWRGGW